MPTFLLWEEWIWRLLPCKLIPKKNSYFEEKKLTSASKNSVKNSIKTKHWRMKFVQIWQKAHYNDVNGVILVSLMVSSVIFFHFSYSIQFYPRRLSPIYGAFIPWGWHLQQQWLSNFHLDEMIENLQHYHELK